VRSIDREAPRRPAGLVEITLLLPHDADIVDGLGIVCLVRDRLPVGADRLVEPALLLQQQPRLKWAWA
jgi:hypothetical protein